MNNFFGRLKKLNDNRFISIYLFRYYKYAIYPKFISKPRIELLCVNADGVKYEVVFKSLPQRISFNNLPVKLKQYSANRGFVWIENQSGVLEIDKYKFELTAKGQKKIDTDSLIIICDRQEKADDNGEFFYQWTLENKPEYTNVYFAIRGDSSHYKRLKNQGFKLLDTTTREFREKYKKADVIVSSVYSETFENYQQLRYKLAQEPTSKFICLQHGVLFNIEAEASINAHQKINYFITNLPYEKQLFKKSKVWFSNQNPLIGMSRINPDIINGEKRDIVYMPTWNEEAVNSSSVRESKLYKSIECLTSSPLLREYLETNDLKVKVVIHPQLGEKSAEFLKLASENIDVYKGEEISYRHEIANCLLLITDHSSVFFDGLFYQKPIVFFHPDQSIVPSMPIFKKAGVVTTDEEQLVSELIRLKESNYQVTEKPEFQLKSYEVINKEIWELIING